MRPARLWLLIALLLALPAAARADVAVFAEVRPPTVAVGEPFRLEVKVRSSGFGNAGDLVVPQSPNLKQAGHASKETMSLVNGRANRERIETYTFVATAPGRYAFQGLGVRSGSSFIPGPVVSVTVQGAGQGAPPAPPPEPPQGAPAASAGLELPPAGEDVFVTAAVDRNHVRVGEPLVYTFRFYYRINPDAPTFDAPDFSGFQAYDLGQSKEGRTTVVDGYTYEYFDLRTLLYPLRAGDLTVGAATLSFRTSFFFTQQYRRRAKPVTVKVDPLPEGAPDSFHGAVGDLTLTASALPTRVALQEPLTLLLTLAGSANFGLVSAPEPVSAGAWRIYPGRITDDTQTTPAGLQGAKKFEVLLQPPETGTLTPPAFRFTYFDRSEEKYVTLFATPEPIEIAGGGAARTAAAAPPLPLRPPRLELGSPLAPPLRPWRLLLWLVPLPLVALVFLAAGGRVNRRLRTVTAADKAHAARRQWERRLSEKQIDAAGLLKAMDAWLHERYGTSVNPSEAEISAALGDRAAPLLLERKRLQSAVFGGNRANVSGVQQALKAWLKGVPAVVLAAALLAGGAAAIAQEAALQLFDTAQQAQIEGRFAEAVRLYRRTGEQAGGHVNLFYNLAGAAWRAGEPALARYAIETAYAYAPRDGDVAANRHLIARAIEGRGGSAQPVAPARLTLAEAGWLSLGLYVLLTLLVIAAWISRPARWAAGLVVALSLPVWGYAFYLYQAEAAEQPGVVWAAGPLREAGNEAGVEIAPVPAGEIGRVTDRRNGWVRIHTAKGLSGWISENHWRSMHLVDGRPAIPE